MEIGGEITAYADESSYLSIDGSQSYSMCAVMFQGAAVQDIRTTVSRLRLPGQAKVHWSDETSKRRRHLVEAICEMRLTAIVVTHVSEPRAKTERFRRLCLERLYWELEQLAVHRLVLESRREVQDKRDRSHIAALHARGQFGDVRIEHAQGRAEPLLWIADVILGALNAASRGDLSYRTQLAGTIATSVTTASSLMR